MSAKGRLSGKVALITGGGSGIGRAAAMRFSAEGATVIVAGTSMPSLDDTVALAGGGATALQLDVVDEDSIERALATIRERADGLDILVNNAGLGGGSGAAHEIDGETWDRELGVNLRSVYQVARQAWPLLAESGGAIVNTASIAGLWAIPGAAAYCVAKAGVIMLTKCLALDGAHVGIRSNCVCPGHTDTPLLDGYFQSQSDPVETRRVVAGMFPLGRIGQPGDIAGAMVYLASDEAAWVTGSAVVVDGGLTTGMWFG